MPGEKLALDVAVPQRRLRREREHGRDVVHHDAAARPEHADQTAEGSRMPDAAVSEDQIERRQYGLSVAGQHSDTGICGIS